MNVLLIAVLSCLGQVAGADADMEALVARIRENLTRVDEMLFETSEAEDVATSLDDVVNKHTQVIRDLDELIKQMKYTPSASSSSSSSGQDPQSPSSQPPPRESDGSQQQEQQESGGEKPNSPQEQSPDGGQQDDQSKENPQAGSQETAEPRQEEGGPPPPDPTANFTREDVDKRWGLLPPKLQERLLNLHVDDLPEQYRAWLEAYIRRMHALESGPGR